MRIRIRKVRKPHEMRCPYCSADEDKVVDSRTAESGAAIRRRRECLECGRRYTTYERAEEVPLIVVKRNGEEEPFDIDKIVDGVRRPSRTVRSPKPTFVRSPRMSRNRARPWVSRPVPVGRDRPVGSRSTTGARRGCLPALRFGVQGLPGAERLRARARPYSRRRCHRKTARRLK